MQTEGASGIFVAIVAVVVGSIVLSGSALLVLRDDSAGDATPSATATELAASSATVTATVTRTSTPTPSPTLTETPPTRTASRTPTPTPEPGVEYVVQPGDVLDLIAAEFGVPSAAIAEENGLVPPYVLEVGQVLVIPAAE